MCARSLRQGCRQQQGGSCARRDCRERARVLPNLMKLLELVVYSVLCWLLFAVAPHGLAQTYQGKQLVKAELLPTQARLCLASRLPWVCLLQMAPGWHTYWKFSGDAGLPTELKWKLPPGWKTGEIQWPIPLKTIDPGDIETYGYENEVLLMQEITPPPNINTSSVKLIAEANWLVCEKICIPGSTTLQLDLPVASNQSAREHGHFRALPPFASAKLAGSECGQRRVEPGWIRCSLEAHKQNFGKISGSRFLSAAGARDNCWSSSDSIAEQQ